MGCFLSHLAQFVYSFFHRIHLIKAQIVEMGLGFVLLRCNSCSVVCKCTKRNLFENKWVQNVYNMYKSMDLVKKIKLLGFSRRGGCKASSLKSIITKKFFTSKYSTQVCNIKECMYFIKCVKWFLFNAQKRRYN